MDDPVLFTCEWCEEEKPTSQMNQQTDKRSTTLMCDQCYAGVMECHTCNVEWTHEDVGCVRDYEYVDAQNHYHCPSCAEHENACDSCGNEVGKDNLQVYSFSEWQDGRKKYFDYDLCPDCYEESNPSIDPQEIAVEMTDDPEEQEEIAEAIQNNMDTGGEIWKQLKNADEEERWQIIRIMGVARSRHEDTDYDDMLKQGVDKDTARELIKE